MKIVIHDYGSYAFPVQLSRALARNGNHVLHLFARHYAQKGRLWKEPTDPDTFSIQAMDGEQSFEKYNLLRRRAFERSYGKAVLKVIDDFSPDVLFNANCALEPASIIQRHCARKGIRYVHWMQDIHAVAIRAILPRKLPVIGSLVAEYYTAMERRLVAEADATIIIANEFADELKHLGMKPRRTITIPNWMPLDEMKPEAKINPWSIRYGLDQTTNIIYFGTLSFKHDQDLYLRLAKHFANRPDVRIVVIGGGIVMDQLQAAKQSMGLDGLVLLGWQNYQDVAYILASADVLLAAVTPEASLFSVPCKVLSYLSVDRAILAAIPPANLVAQILIQNDMGLVAPPSDVDAVIAAADRLIADPALRASMAARGLDYARRTFEIDAITRTFQNLIVQVVGHA